MRKIRAKRDIYCSHCMGIIPVGSECYSKSMFSRVRYCKECGSLLDTIESNAVVLRGIVDDREYFEMYDYNLRCMDKFACRKGVNSTRTLF